MPDPGFTAKKIQEAVDLTSQNMASKDRDTARGLFGKIVIAGISVVGISLLVLLIYFNFNVIMVADKIMTGGRDLINFVTATVFNTKTPIREPIASQPDIPKEKAKASASETPSDISGQIQNGGGIKVWKAPSAPVVAPQTPIYQPILVPQPIPQGEVPQTVTPQAPGPSDPVKNKVESSKNEKPEDIFKGQ